MRDARRETDNNLNGLVIEEEQGINGLVPEEVQSYSSADKQQALEELKKVGELHKDAVQSTIPQFQQPQSEQLDKSGILRRAFMNIEDGEWNEAERILDRIKDEDRKNPKYWIAKLLCEYKVRKEERLARFETDFSNDGFYKTAIKYAEGEYKKKIETYCYYCIYAKVRHQLPQAAKNKYPEYLIKWLKQIQGYMDADVLLKDYCEKSYQYALYLKDALPESEHVKEISRLLQNLPDLDENDEILQYCNRMKVVVEKRYQAKKIIVAMDKEKGENWLEPARYYMESGDYDYAYYCYFQANERGKNTDTERKKLISMMDEAIRAGKEGYLFYRGVMYYYEEKDYENARRCFEEAYEKEEVYSGFGMGVLYFFAPFNNNPYEHNAQKAKEYFRKASDRRNDPESVYYYARCCQVLEEDGTDYENLIKIYENCVWWFYKNGNPELYCARLYWWMNYRNGNLEQDFGKARYYYHRAIQKENLYAMESFVTGFDNENNPYPEEVFEEKEIWKEIKKCCEILFEKKRYKTACVYAQFFSKNYDVEVLDVYTLNRQKQAEIILEAADAGEISAIVQCVEWTLNREIPNLRGWDWLDKLLEGLYENGLSEADRQFITGLRSQIAEKRKEEHGNKLGNSSKQMGLFQRITKRKK